MEIWKIPQNKIYKNIFITKTPQKANTPPRSYTEACYSSLLNLPVDKQPSLLDNQETYAKMLSLELSHEELLDKIGMETSYGGTLDHLCNVLRHTIKTLQNKLKKQRSGKIESLKEELNVLKTGTNSDIANVTAKEKNSTYLVANFWKPNLKK